MSATDVQVWDAEAVGRWSEPPAFTVERARIAAYADATGDEHPAHAAGDLAPPVFAIVPVFEAILPVLTGPVPEDLVVRGVHGQQDMCFHRPIRPGQALTSRVAAVGITQRSTGAVVNARARTCDERGRLVVEQTMTYFVRGGRFGRTIGEPLPEHAFPTGPTGSEPVARVEQGFDADTTQRYAKASGDPMPIHLDEAIARKVGLPGIIVHGLCTMAYTSRAVIATACPEDPTRLKRLAVRFSSVVQPSETITTALWADGSSAHGDARLVFETTTSSGVLAIRDGLAEIAPEGS